MKNLLRIIVLAFIFISTKAQAQHFGIQGSSWYYSNVYVVPGPTIEGYINITSNGDTTIQGKLCNRLQLNTPIGCGDGQVTKFTYYSNDSVYFYEPAYNSFQLLVLNKKELNSYYHMIAYWNCIAYLVFRLS